MTKREWRLIVIGYAILALGFIVVTIWLTHVTSNQHGSDQDLYESQIHLAESQAKMLSLMQRSQVFDCEDRLAIRRQAHLPEPKPGSLGDCAKIFDVYQDLVDKAQRLTIEVHQHHP